MSFQITQGLFRFDFIDHHAVLGVPVDADSKEIRKRYMLIAKTLHPDSRSTASDEDKQLATEILSKLVNPAYEKLSQDKERAEHAVLLRLKGQQASQQPETIELKSELSRTLAHAPDTEATYKESVKKLAQQQYESLDRMQAITGELSELNLIYLTLKVGRGEKPTQPRKAPSAPPTMTRPPSPPPPPKVTPVDQYYRRAEELMSKGNLAQAILELRDALKLEPSNSSCHSLLGEIYLKQNQSTMAKVHINQALKHNPKDPKALEVQKKMEIAAQKAASKAANSGKSGGKSNKKGDDGGITIFGIKIGGKKK